MDINQIKSQNKTTLAHSKTQNISSSSQARTITESNNLQAGQHVKGLVVDLRIDEATIQLENTQETIVAKLDGYYTAGKLSIGQSAVFEVKEVSPEVISLKLLQDMIKPETETTIEKALQEAGLPLTAINKEIVQELLNNRMPIGKQVLQYLTRLANYNKDTSTQSLVQMYRFQIPITKENILQFKAMEQGSNHLIDELNTTVKNLLDLLQPQDISNELSHDNAEAPQISNSLIGQNTNLSSDLAKTRGTDSLLNNVLDNLINEDSITNNSLINKVNEDNITNNSLINKVDEEVNKTTGESIINSNSSKPLDSRINDGTLINNVHDLLKFLLTDDIQTMPNSSATPDYLSINRYLLNDQELLEAQGLLSNIVNYNELETVFNDKNISSHDIIGLIQNNINKWNTSTVNTVLSAPIYRKLIEKTLENRWSITPKQIEKGFPIDELYRRLQRDIEAIERIVPDTNTVSIKEVNAEAPTKKITNQINFMKSLNDMFLYLQLPVQLKDQTVHSELYVFRRKSHLNNKKGSVSALLHMDMPHLGTIDIHVSLDRNHIKAIFYTTDNQVGTLIEQNLSKLKDALHNKGFYVQSEIKSTGEKPILEKAIRGEGIPDTTISRYTFDIRT